MPGKPKPTPGPHPKPTFRKSSDRLVALFEAAARDFPQVELRKVFGYPCGFVKNHMAFGLHEEHFFVRIGKDDQAQLLSLEGTHHLEPMPGRPMTEYIVLPESVTRSRSKLRTWIEEAIDYTATLPPKVKNPVRGKRQ